MSINQFCLVAIIYMLVTTGLELRYDLHFDMTSWKYWVGNCLLWASIYLIDRVIKTK
ncbi:hypothetical protein MZD04_gp389 [Pseudomonas phage Psa21]|uniref:Uncharacterized protein n=1 Tax=Pseudomonas phage Psa21 TaxID=2530023 RepID=A0A481W5X9_9CAUD|nr:hypothetical protein MZD04_gp389 [Pseudomonas phage Psa21]QBJ02915.1 hypothetical protein PSA21_389 [Pseudomonas phage Psa21]